MATETNDTKGSATPAGGGTGGAGGQSPAASASTSVSDNLMKEAGITGDTAAAKPATNGTEKTGLENTLNTVEEPVVLKPGDEGYVAPVELKPGDEGYVAPAGKATPAKKVEKSAATAAPASTITNETLLAELQKIRPDIKSLDDLKKPETAPKVLSEAEAAEERAKRQTEAMKYGLDKKIFSKADYDKYQTALQGDKVEAVKNAFVARMMEEDKDLDEAEAKEMFDLKYGQLEDDKSRLFKTGMKEIENEFNNLLRKNYGKIMDVETIYEGVQRNVEKGKVFLGKIDSVFSDKIKPEYSVKLGSEKAGFEDYPVELFKPEELVEARSNYLSEDMMNALMDENGDIDEEVVTTEVMKDLVWKNLDKIIAQVATSYGDRQVELNKMTRKGIKLESEIELGQERTGTPKNNSFSDRLMSEAGIGETEQSQT